MVGGLDVVGVRHVGELIELMAAMPPIRFPIHRLPTRPPRINRPQVIPTIVAI